MHNAFWFFLYAICGVFLLFLAIFPLIDVLRFYLIPVVLFVGLWLVWEDDKQQQKKFKFKWGDKKWKIDINEYYKLNSLTPIMYRTESGGVIFFHNGCKYLLDKHHYIYNLSKNLNT